MVIKLQVTKSLAHLQKELFEVAAQAAESPTVRDSLLRGDGYSVRINKKHPNAKLHDIYLVFSTDNIVVDVIGCTSTEMRDLAAKLQRQFGRAFPGYQAARSC